MTVAAAILSAVWRMFAVTGESASGLRPPDAATFSTDGGCAHQLSLPPHAGPPVLPSVEPSGYVLDPDEHVDAETMKQIACVIARVAAQCVIVAAPEFGWPSTSPPVHLEGVG